MQRFWLFILLGVLVTAALAVEPEEMYPPAASLPGPPPVPVAEYVDGDRDVGNCRGYECPPVHHPICSHAGIPELFCEPPLGYYVNNAMRAQVRQGVADQLVIYHYDFLFGRYAADLSPRGKHQLDICARLMTSTGAGPLVIEASADPKLDHFRRLSVIAALVEINDAIPAEAVVIGRPRTPALRGEEATLVYGNELLNTQNRGRLITPSATISTSFSASSSSASNFGAGISR